MCCALPAHKCKKATRSRFAPDFLAGVECKFITHGRTNIVQRAATCMRLLNKSLIPCRRHSCRNFTLAIRSLSSWFSPCHTLSSVVSSSKAFQFRTEQTQQSTHGFTPLENKNIFQEVNKKSQTCDGASEAANSGVSAKSTM